MKFSEIVFTQLSSGDMYFKRGAEFFDRNDFHQNPLQYESNFYPFTKAADLLINGIYWDKRIPAFFTVQEMKEKDFRIKQIADITCDIAPNSSIPSTLRASTIQEPYYGYEPVTETITMPFTNDVVDVMAIDNLPNELPRDASEDFGNMFMSRIFPELVKAESALLKKATIAEHGDLTENFLYLRDYVA